MECPQNGFSLEEASPSGRGMQAEGAVLQRPGGALPSREDFSLLLEGVGLELERGRGRAGVGGVHSVEVDRALHTPGQGRQRERCP